MPDPDDIDRDPDSDIARRLAAGPGDAAGGPPPLDPADLGDIAYATTDTPVGELLVAVTPRGLVRLAWAAEGVDRVLDDLAGALSASIVRAPARVEAVRRELDEYFAGTRYRFDVPVDWVLTRGFTRQVLQSTARIPFGRLRTYTEMAAEAGSPRGARAAGNALGSNPIPVVVPCHRVVRAGGALGGYTGGLDRKRALLTLEGSLRPGWRG